MTIDLIIGRDRHIKTELEKKFSNEKIVWVKDGEEYGNFKHLNSTCILVIHFHNIFFPAWYSFCHMLRACHVRTFVVLSEYNQQSLYLFNIKGLSYLTYAML